VSIAFWSRIVWHVFVQIWVSCFTNRIVLSRYIENYHIVNKYIFLVRMNAYTTVSAAIARRISEIVIANTVDVLGNLVRSFSL